MNTIINWLASIDLGEELIISKLFLATVLGALFGYDRDAGPRTYASACVGVALFTSTAGRLEDAATIWSTAAVGVAVDPNMFVIATASTLLVYYLIRLHTAHGMCAENSRFDRTLITLTESPTPQGPVMHRVLSLGQYPRSLLIVCHTDLQVRASI